MAPTLDPEGAHLAALHRATDFRGARVLEMGCGDGRLTEGIAEEASRVVAFDPDAEAVEQARELVHRETSPGLLDRRLSSHARSSSSLKRQAT